METAEPNSYYFINWGVFLRWQIIISTVHCKYKEYADEKRILKAGSFVQFWKGLNFVCIIKIRDRKLKSNAKCWAKISQEYLLYVVKPPPSLSPKSETLHSAFWWTAYLGIFSSPTNQTQSARARMKKTYPQTGPYSVMSFVWLSQKPWKEEK